MKLRGPMFSLEASGTLAGVLTMLRAGGKQSCKANRPGRDPRNDQQLRARALFAWLSTRWQLMPSDQQATWDTRARTRGTTPKNTWLGTQISNWRGFLYPANLDPAARVLTPATVTTAAVQSTSTPTTIAFLTASAADNAGYTLHRSDTTGFTPTRATAIAWTQENQATAQYLRDDQAPIGTSNYLVVPFSTDGNVGTPSNEVEATNPATPTPPGGTPFTWIASVDPIDHRFNTNNADNASATAVDVLLEDYANIDRKAALMAATHIKWTQVDDPGNVIEFDITAPAGDGGFFVELNIAFTGGSPTLLYNVVYLWEIT